MEVAQSSPSNFARNRPREKVTARQRRNRRRNIVLALLQHAPIFGPSEYCARSVSSTNLIGIAAAYAGYSYVLLGEGMCNPAVSRINPDRKKPPPLGGGFLLHSTRGSNHSPSGVC